MVKIELEIVANNSQYIVQTKEVEQATQSMYNTAASGTRRQKGLIEDLTESIKELEEKRRKAFTTEGIEKYNKKIAEAKKDLKEYEQAGVSANQKIEKSGNTLLKSVGKWALGFATVATAVKLFKGIIASTETTTHAFEKAIAEARAGVGYFFKSIASGDWSNFGEGFQNAIKGAGEFVDAMEIITNKTNEQLIRSAKYDKEISDLRTDTFNRDDENNEKRKKALTDIIDLQKKKYDEEATLLESVYQANLKKAASDSGLSEQQIENFIREYSSLEEVIKAGEEYNKITKAMRQPGNNGEYFMELDNERKALGENAKEAGLYVKQIGKVTEETRKQLASYSADAIQKSAQFNATNRRDKMQLDALDQEMKKKELDRLKKVKDDETKRLEEFLKDSLQLEDDYEKSKIDNLKGLDKIAAERQYQLKQIELLRAHLESLGTLTDQHYIWLDGLISQANKKAELDRADYYKKEYEDAKQAKEKKQKLEDERIGYERELRESTLDLIDNNEREALELKIQFAEEDIALLKKRGSDETDIKVRLLRMQIEALKKGLEEVVKEESFPSIWNMIGLGDNPEAQDAIKEAIKAVKDSLDEIFDARVEDAKRTTDLLDEQIANTNDALANEIELAKAGYANNVDAKQKELAELKKQREKALKEEQQALKAQKALDTASQISSLVTASANIFKKMAKDTVSTIIAIATIGVMFGAFAAAKIKAQSAAKLAKGDTGVVTGNLHSEGGERFGDHIEVERGEAWGVLSRPATKKYGKIFSEMVNSFNKGKLPTVSNNIIVDTDKTVHELVNVKGELVKINRYNAAQKEVHQLPGMRIERSGHKTRIIRNV
jgi:hypothetical protein